MCYFSFSEGVITPSNEVGLMTLLAMLKFSRTCVSNIFLELRKLATYVSSVSTLAFEEEWKGSKDFRTKRMEKNISPRQFSSSFAPADYPYRAVLRFTKVRVYFKDKMVGKRLGRIFDGRLK